MSEQDSGQVVTLTEALEQVKKWAKEKNYEQVKEGCEEILQVEPDNKEIKDLLEQANNALKPQSAPVAAVPPVVPAPVPAAPVSPEPVQAPKVIPVSQVTPEDIFKKPSAEVKKEEIKPAAPAPVKAAEETKQVEEPSTKSGIAEKLLAVVFIAIILGCFIFAFTQGWLNTVYDWILGLFGL